MWQSEVGVMEWQAREHQKLQAKYRKLGRHRVVFPCVFQRELGPDVACILDFQPPELF